MIRVRLLGTPQEIALALYRLRAAFSEVTASEPVSARTEGHVRVYCTVRL